ncbi:MAG: 30S ribosomal protein S12 methylthiotransferase RimO [Firmicutes bacterium]|nr:30S ribosomal protein S12 methylthiotransferase RimO [Bacillota bacterium]
MNLTVGLVSLGCAKNLVDSEIMLGYLDQDGFQIVSDPAEADVIIVNTCGFIGPAKEESIDSILEMAEYKTTGRCRCLIVTGCLSTRYKDELWQEMPEIDGLLGTNEMDKVTEVIKQVLSGQRVINLSQQYFSYDNPNIPRVISTGNHTAYLKIAEGCDHQCSFCAIPLIRGPYRSRQPQSILQEAEILASNGVKELILIAQDTTRYGLDLNNVSLVTLLKDLVKLDIPWIRLMYTYPHTFSDELLDLMAEHDNLLSYVDLPLQHSAKSVLQRMKRGGSYESQLNLINKIRQQVPDVKIRSSFIVGFPGETDQEFEELLAFLKEATFDHAGIFQYSPEEGTLAAELERQVSDEVKQYRYDQAMQLQQQISLKKQQQLIGKEVELLICGRSAESDLVLVGRHRGQAPDVDGLVYVGNAYVNSGDFVKAKITQADPYDLVGEIIV